MSNVKTYIVDFPYNEGVFCFELSAESWEDAEAKLAAIRDSSEVIGELVERIDASAVLEVPLAQILIARRDGTRELHF